MSSEGSRLEALGLVYCAYGWFNELKSEIDTMLCGPKQSIGGRDFEGKEGKSSDLSEHLLNEDEFDYDIGGSGLSDALNSWGETWKICADFCFAVKLLRTLSYGETKPESGLRLMNQAVSQFQNLSRRTKDDSIRYLCVKLTLVAYREFLPDETIDHEMLAQVEEEWFQISKTVDIKGSTLCAKILAIVDIPQEVQSVLKTLSSISLEGLSEVIELTEIWTKLFQCFRQDTPNLEMIARRVVELKGIFVFKKERNPDDHFSANQVSQCCLILCFIYIKISKVKEALDSLDELLSLDLMLQQVVSLLRVEVSIRFRHTNHLIVSINEISNKGMKLYYIALFDLLWSPIHNEDEYLDKFKSSFLLYLNFEKGTQVMNVCRVMNILELSCSTLQVSCIDKVWPTFDEVLTEVEKFEADNHILSFLSARALTMMSHETEAIRIIESLSEMDISDPSIMFWHSLALLRTSQIVEARSQFSLLQVILEAEMPDSGGESASKLYYDLLYVCIQVFEASFSVADAKAYDLQDIGSALANVAEAFSGSSTGNASLIAGWSDEFLESCKPFLLRVFVSSATNFCRMVNMDYRLIEACSSLSFNKTLRKTDVLFLPRLLSSLYTVEGSLYHKVISTEIHYCLGNFIGKDLFIETAPGSSKVSASLANEILQVLVFTDIDNEEDKSLLLKLLKYSSFSNQQTSYKHENILSDMDFNSNLIEAFALHAAGEQMKSKILLEKMFSFPTKTVEYFQLINAYTLYIKVLLSLGFLKKARSWIKIVSQEWGDARHKGRIACLKSLVLVYDGRVQQAVRLLDNVVKVIGNGNDSRSILVLRCKAGIVLGHRNDIFEFKKCYEKISALARDTDADIFRVESLLLLGEYKQAADMMLDVFNKKQNAVGKASVDSSTLEVLSLYLQENCFDEVLPKLLELLQSLDNKISSKNNSGSTGVDEFQNVFSIYMLALKLMKVCCREKNALKLGKRLVETTELRLGEGVCFKENAIVAYIDMGKLSSCLNSFSSAINFLYKALELSQEVSGNKFSMVLRQIICLELLLLPPESERARTIGEKAFVLLRSEKKLHWRTLLVISTTLNNLLFDHSSQSMYSLFFQSLPDENELKSIPAYALLQILFSASKCEYVSESFDQSRRLLLGALVKIPTSQVQDRFFVLVGDICLLAMKIDCVSDVLNWIKTYFGVDIIDSEVNDNSVYSDIRWNFVRGLVSKTRYKERDAIFMFASVIGRCDKVSCLYRNAHIHMIEIYSGISDKMISQGLSAETFEDSSEESENIGTMEKLLNELITVDNGNELDSEIEVVIVKCTILISSKEAAKVKEAISLLVGQIGEKDEEYSDDQVGKEADAIYSQSMYLLSAAFFLIGEESKARMQLKRLSKFRGSYESMELIDKAKILLARLFCRDQKFDLAFPLVKDVIKRNPGCVSALEMLGLVHEFRGEKLRALESYKKALEATSMNRPDIALIYSKSLLACNQTLEAITLCQALEMKNSQHQEFTEMLLKQAQGMVR